MKKEWRGVLADIERAGTPRGRSGLGRFAIEGTRVHERAVRAGAPVEACLVARGFLAAGEERAQRLLAELEATGCALHFVPDAVLLRLTEGRSIGAITGLVRFPAPMSLSQVVSCSPGGSETILVGVDIEDPGNVGAMVRTALASGAIGFVGVGISDPYHPRAVRVSMGSLFKLPILRFASVAPLLEGLEKIGAKCVGSISSGGVPLHERDSIERPVAVFLGAEATGLAADVRAAMDALVTIPMREGVDSFSVNAAAAILLYEIGREARERSS